MSATPMAASPSGSLVAVGEPQLPFERDVLTLGVAVDPLLVAAELRVVARQQYEACQGAGAELVEHLVIAPVAVDLPMRRHGPQVHDACVRSWRDVVGDF